MTDKTSLPGAADLHAAIMNLPCRDLDAANSSINHEIAYKQGHRDARHAAAELALSGSPQPQPVAVLHEAWCPAANRRCTCGAALSAPAVEPVAVMEAPEVVTFDDYPEFHEEAMGCGLEDRGIRDRYEAMRYGWEQAMERVAERIDGFLEDLPASASPAEQAATQAEVRATLMELAKACNARGFDSPIDNSPSQKFWYALRDRGYAAIDLLDAAPTAPTGAQAEPKSFKALYDKLEGTPEYEAIRKEVAEQAAPKAEPTVTITASAWTCDCTARRIRTGDKCDRCGKPAPTLTITPPTDSGRATGEADHG